jgi:ActR/RegA family two-component response regulator
MVDATSPVLLVMGSDQKRLQWLTHHVSSRWPDAAVTTVPAADGATLSALVEQTQPHAVLLQADFGVGAEAGASLGPMLQLLRMRPKSYCIVLAERGDERSAVRALKSGAMDYLPLGTITRDMLLTAVDEALAARRAEVLATGPLTASLSQVPTLEIPGYSIVKEIATSNFSAVYLARSERLRRNVVLKTMARGTSPRELEDAERFQREYQIISSITHPAIAEIYDFGTLPEHLYSAMEYFPCGDLKDRLRNPVSVAESLYYLRAIAEALRVIHVFGILHRDLKPANVMLREDNSPVLIDFGLARRTADDAAMTAVGKVVGSPNYISPEQAQGQRVDLRTDLYSLGVIFFEMLTGLKPYVGRNAMEVMRQHAQAPVPMLPEQLAAQQPLLDRLMAKSVHERYASADELLADLGTQEPLHGRTSAAL